MRCITKYIVLFSAILTLAFFVIHSKSATRLDIKNGRIVVGDQTIVGIGLINGMWAPRDGPNITRRTIDGQTGPYYMEDLDERTDSMVKYNYPAYEHNFGLWFDRRRDSHNKICHKDGNVKGPFLEQPWARSKTGTACDGLPLYDLEKFNSWYFQRLKEFAALTTSKGLIFHHNYYLQHALLETQAHYMDFPWRPENTIQKTGMPSTVPAANSFYDTTNIELMRLHRLYIRKVLNEIGDYNNVFHFPGQEYTGGVEFLRFWMDTIIEWENEIQGRSVMIGIAATKDVLDNLLNDKIRSKHIDVIDLRFFWIEEDGDLFAVEGGKEFPGRMFFGGDIMVESSSNKIYQQTVEYRLNYPDKIITHAVNRKISKFLPFMMGGGSISYVKAKVRKSEDIPAEYQIPEIVRPLYGFKKFFRQYLADSFHELGIDSNNTKHNENLFVLSSETSMLAYTINSDNFELDLTGLNGNYRVVWFGPYTDTLIKQKALLAGGAVTPFSPPDQKQSWMVWLEPAD